MMKSMLVIFALAVFSFIDVSNGECTAEKGTSCKNTYEGSVNSSTSAADKCTAAYAYGKCLLDAMCSDNATQKTAFTTAVGADLSCSDCKVSEGLNCFTEFCSNKTGLKSCLDSKTCYVEVFKTAYDKYDATCNGCSTVTVSVLMMFLSTLLMFIKNY
ncbi:hypothetical protein SNE40_016190 [Patella caerulea]|uniref:Transmembrane protein n=1 Tax=Patella caerulea TaxID=87958 RepID=A0AAN8PBR7_PATCE